VGNGPGPVNTTHGDRTTGPDDVQTRTAACEDRPVTDRPTLSRVHPAPHAPVTVAEAYDVERPAPTGRPWVGLCMVASLDGAVAVDGSSGGLGNANDVEVLVTLRLLADVVLVGAGTAAGEGYGPPSKAGQRIAVATNSGSVDLDRQLFTSGAGFLLAPESAPIDESRVEVVRAGSDRLDLGVALARLHEVVRGVAYVAAEGGPTLNAALAGHDLVDELDLTWSPRFAGSGSPRLIAGGEPVDRRFDLAHLLVDADGFVFSRWVRRRAC
jgi:riboflavin biosynthesis pyrimidine reductase